MKQTLCFGWIYSKFSTSLFLVSDTFLTTSVSRDSRLSELWVSPPSQGSRSFSLCSPLIRPVTAASVKLSETWRKECIYLCTAWYHTHARTQAPLSLLRKQSAHHASRASERVLTANVYMESLTVQKDTPSYIQTQVQQDLGGRGVPLQKKKQFSWAGIGESGSVSKTCE